MAIAYDTRNMIMQLQIDGADVSKFYTQYDRAYDMRKREVIG